MSDSGRSNGGFSRKLHAARDALGTLFRFFVTAGQRSESRQALDLIDRQKLSAWIDGKKGMMLVIWVMGVKGVHAKGAIPPRSQRKTPRKYDHE